MLCVFSYNSSEHIMHFSKTYIKKISNIIHIKLSLPQAKLTLVVLIGTKKKPKIENQEVQLHKQMSLQVHAFLIYLQQAFQSVQEKFQSLLKC